MTWLVVCIPLMALALIVALAPLAVATRHQHKYGHHGSRPDALGATTARSSRDAVPDGAPTACPACRAPVVDQAWHDEAVHPLVDA